MVDNIYKASADQYIVEHTIQVADDAMKISLVFTLEDQEHISLNIENEVSGSEANFSLSKEELEGVFNWVQAKIQV